MTRIREESLLSGTQQGFLDKLLSELGTTEGYREEMEDWRREDPYLSDYAERALEHGWSQQGIAMFSGLGEHMAKMPKEGATPWLETSPEKVVSRWEEYLAKPMMSAWKEVGEPLARRKYNLPGSFYSADASRGMLREGEDFLQRSLMPSLYSSTENMFNRLYGLAAGLTTTQTQENIAQPEFKDYALAGLGSGIGLGLGSLFG